jgi:hypothetical protein
MNIVEFEIKTVLAAIKGKTPGLYEASELLDAIWSRVRRPRWYGIQFRKAVRVGKVPRVRCVGKKSNKHLLYELLAE